MEDVEKEEQGTIAFEHLDLIKDVPQEKSWWPSSGFDLVLDKGTFDAVSLSAETVELEGQSVRIVELYPRKVARMVKSGGFLMVTTVNWTEDEIVRWFTEGPGVENVLELHGRVQYQVYEYGGHKGSAIASICFRKIVDC